MKIVRVDDDHALLIKGWFRKRQARVYESSYGYWRYEVGDVSVNSWIRHRLNRMYHPLTFGPRWEPIPRKVKLPLAKLLTPGEK